MSTQQTSSAGALGFVGAGAAMRVVTSVFLAVAGFVVSLVLVRSLGAQGYGIVGFVASVVGLAGLLAGGGFGVAAARELAADGGDGSTPRDETIRGLVTVVVAGTAVGALVALAIVVPRAQGVVIPACAATVFLLAGRNASGAAAAVARGSGRPLRTDLAVLASSATIVIGALLVGAGGLGRGAALMAYAAGGVAGSVIAAVVIRGLVPPGGRALRPDIGAGRAFLRLSIPYLLAGAAQQVIANVDVVLLGIVRSTGDVGRYEPVLRVIDRLALFVPLMLVVGFMPMATRLFTSGRSVAFVDLYQRVARVAFWLGFPALVGLWVFPDEILHLLFGPSFPVSTAVVRILVAGYGVNLIGGPNAAALVATGRRAEVLWTTLAGMAASILTAAIAIPLAGAVGAALATAAGFVVLNLAVGVALARATGAHPFGGRSAALLASSVIPAVVVASASGSVGGAGGALAVTTGVWLAWSAAVIWLGLLPGSDLRALLRFRTSFEATEAPA